MKETLVTGPLLVGLDLLSLQKSFKRRKALLLIPSVSARASIALHRWSQAWQS